MFWQLLPSQFASVDFVCERAPEALFRGGIRPEDLCGSEELDGFRIHEDLDHAKQAISVGADDYVIKYSLTETSLAEVLGEMEKKRKKRHYEMDLPLTVNEDINQEGFWLFLYVKPVPEFPLSLPDSFCQSTPDCR